MRIKILIISIFILIFLPFFQVIKAYSQENTKKTPEIKRKVEALIDKGIRYEHEDKLDEAIETFKLALTLDPENLLVQVRLAKILSWRGRYEEALKILNNVLKRHPDHSEALFRKAQILSWEGKYKEAIATYQIYLLKEKNDADALMGIARVCFWDGEYEKAIEYFNRAIKAGADKIDAYLNLGKIYLAIEQKEKAKEMFKKVLEIDPKNKEAKRFLRGIRLLKTVEIEPSSLKWYIYTDGTFSISDTVTFLYHYRQKMDFLLKYIRAAINGDIDNTFSFEYTYMGINNLYLGSKIGFTFQPDFSAPFFTGLNLHYRFGKIVTAGFELEFTKYLNDDLLSFKPEIQKDFSDVSYARIRFNQYFFRSGYKTSSVDLYVQFEYFDQNTIYVTATYGGDAEIKDPDRRVFDFGFGISYNISDNLEIKFTYGWIETEYGKTHQFGWKNTVKW